MKENKDILDENKSKENSKDMNKKNDKNKKIVIEKYEENEIPGFCFTNLVYIFIICAMLGWVVETIYVFLACGKLVSRGMTYGPYCSIYGLAGSEA